MRLYCGKSTLLNFPHCGTKDYLISKWACMCVCVCVCVCRRDVRRVCACSTDCQCTVTFNTVSLILCSWVMYCTFPSHSSPCWSTAVSSAHAPHERDRSTSSGWIKLKKNGRQHKVNLCSVFPRLTAFCTEFTRCRFWTSSNAAAERENETLTSGGLPTSTFSASFTA